MSQDNNDMAMRKVDLSDQIASRLMCGFSIAPEDVREAEELGLDIEHIAAVVGACYEYPQTEE
jgi:hypothetical protein